MKLWIKVSLIAIIICALAMSICTVIILDSAAQNEINNAVQTGMDRHYMFVYSLIKSLNNSWENSLSDITNETVIEYYFKKSAIYFEVKNEFYSLMQNSKYIYYSASYNPFQFIDQPEDGARHYSIVENNNKNILIIAGNIEWNNKKYTVYYSYDITDIFINMENLVYKMITVMICMLILLSIILFTLIRFAMSPVKRLSKAARKIAEGTYSQRISIDSNDEIGKLSNNFNSMAEAVEKHISEVEQISEQRRLLLAGLTHELKTPMTSIIGYSNSLMHFKMSGEQKELAIKRIYEQSKRAEKLSQKLINLITLEGGEEIEITAIEISDLFNEIYSTAEFNLKQRNQRLINDKVSLNKIYGDTELIFSLLTNLIDNASKASPDGALIYLNAYSEGDTNSERNQNELAILEIKDNGFGIPENELPLISQPFYRIDKARSGSGNIGLGLSLCEIIAQKHKGKIEIDSKLGIGTTVRIIFPAGMKS